LICFVQLYNVAVRKDYQQALVIITISKRKYILAYTNTRHVYKPINMTCIFLFNK